MGTVGWIVGPDTKQQYRRILRSGTQSKRRRSQTIDVPANIRACPHVDLQFIVKFVFEQQQFQLKYVVSVSFGFIQQHRPLRMYHGCHRSQL